MEFCFKTDHKNRIQSFTMLRVACLPFKRTQNTADPLRQSGTSYFLQ